MQKVKVVSWFRPEKYFSMKMLKCFFRIPVFSYLLSILKKGQRAIRKDWPQSSFTYYLRSWCRSLTFKCKWKNSATPVFWWQQQMQSSHSVSNHDLTLCCPRHERAERGWRSLLPHKEAGEVRPVACSSSYITDLCDWLLFLLSQNVKNNNCLVFWCMNTTSTKFTDKHIKNPVTV